jgi:hypothetical protein
VTNTTHFVLISRRVATSGEVYWRVPGAEAERDDQGGETDFVVGAGVVVGERRSDGVPCERDVAAALAEERGHLLSRVTEGFDLADVVFPLVHKQGCITVKTNFYSVPVRAGARVEARIHPLHVEIWHTGRLIARHERCHSRRQHVLDLEHYLDILSHKPGAFAGSKPLAPWREAGRWPACHDELWDRLRARHGKQSGTRAMVAVLALGREFGHDHLRTAVAATVSH